MQRFLTESSVSAKWPNHGGFVWPQGQHRWQTRGLNTWTRGVEPPTPGNSHTGRVSCRFGQSTNNGGLWAEVCKIRRLVGRHLTSDMNELGDNGLVEVRLSVVQKFWKSVKIWQSYGGFKGGNFFMRDNVLPVSIFTFASSSACHSAFCLPHFVQIGPAVVELWRHSNFQDGSRQPYRIFSGVTAYHPRSANDGLRSVFKCRLDCCFMLWSFDFKLPITWLYRPRMRRISC